ncbi:MAG: HDOD domain-containing protein [Planctomycetia bacterium]|nr:HDOD domain-containing protein [Planctomycetia bacterium]
MLATLEPNELDLTPPPEIVALLNKRAHKLRMLPAVAVEALELAKNPECTISEFATFVERDVKLATDMLKIANSALYCPTTPILNLHRAVVRLGFRECQYLIMTASVSSLMNRLPLDQEWIREVHSRHSFNTALLAIHMNRIFHFGFQGEEFTAGLMHDFGRLLIALVAPERFKEIDPMDFDESPETLVREHALLGTDHCRLGAWYATQQKLPAPLPTVILHHHQPELAEQSQKLTTLIAVADHMANHLQRHEESAGYNPDSNPFWPALADHADATVEKHFHELVPAMMEVTQRDAASLMKS